VSSQQYGAAGNGSAGPVGVDSEEVVGEVLQSPNGDMFDGSRFGLGNYDEKLYWQQVRGFRKALITYQMFGPELRERAIVETQRRLAVNGHHSLDYNDELVKFGAYEDLDEDERAGSAWAESPEGAKTLREYGREIWAELGNPNTDGLSDEQQKAMREHTGVSDRFVSVFESLENMRHEGSRSKGARLVDNVLTAAQTLRDERSALGEA